MGAEAIRRSGHAAITRSREIDWRFVNRSTSWLVPLGFIAVSGLVVLKYILTPVWIGVDATLYAAASAAWLQGGDPWAVREAGFFFAAPPPTLLAFLPFAWMPPPVVSGLWIGGSFLLAGLAVRNLRLPLWWIAFPPLVDGALVGNPDVAVLALLVVGRGRLSWLAPLFKIYAVIPMVGERRWRQLAITGLVLVASAFFLPWATWFGELPAIMSNLANTSGTTSVYGRAVLMAIAIVALLSLGLTRAGWLAVPLLWPNTQLHYAAISVPGLTPFLALAWCFPTPELWVAATCCYAIGHRVLGLSGRKLGVNGI